MNAGGSGLTLLIVSDLHNAISRVNELCDYVIRRRPVDVVLVCGDFVQPAERSSPEKIAAAEGDMTALISRLEMIVCRVIYVPGPNDPCIAKRSQGLPKLTPYSINCDDTQIVLLPDDDHDISYRQSQESIGSSELIVEGFGNAPYGRLAMQIRTKYTVDDHLCNVYRKFARLPWCCRIMPGVSKCGSIEQVENGQVVLLPGRLVDGYFAIVEIGPRSLHEYDEEEAWDVKECKIYNLDAEIQG
ncbi:hypothetical protein THRCLA_08661 [Thraustotheca clavata]|uniref:Calcineurin-like phosphoesterase domain-containing protein n=1 Tax=Thraustotheca clavata TaxID=74557 RepID=A0A1V9Z3L7_9STRA|nr:hypothetical protein THRCLA_08661 [Thraustotheca clavata]